MGGRTGKKSKEETQEKAKEERSLPVLACPFSPSQKLHNIQTAPASSGFLLLPQYPCCLRLSWTPVNRAMRDRAFCSPIFSCMFWSLSPFPKQLQKQEVGATLHCHSYPCKCCGSTPRVHAPPESAYLFVVLVLLGSSLLVCQEVKQNERP